MSYEKFLEIYNEHFSSDGTFDDSCFGNITTMDIIRCYNFVKARVGKCSCAFTIVEQEKVEYCATYMVLLRFAYAPELEGNEVMSMTLDCMKVQGIASTRF